MVTHESTRTFTPERLRVLVACILTKRDPPKSRSNLFSLAGREVQQTLPPTFLFLQSSVFKEQTSQTRCRGPLRFWLRGRSSVAHAALLNFAEGSFRSELLRRQRRAALVCEAYIVGGPSGCQQPNSSFLNFLRRSPADATSHAGLRPCRWKDSSFRRFRSAGTAFFAPRCPRFALAEDVRQRARRGPPTRARAFLMWFRYRSGRGARCCLASPAALVRLAPRIWLPSTAIRPHCRPITVRDGLLRARRTSRAALVLARRRAGSAKRRFVDLRGMTGNCLGQQ